MIFADVLLWSILWDTFADKNSAVFKQPEHRIWYHTVHAGVISALWHSSLAYTLIKLFAQSPPISSDVELQ